MRPRDARVAVVGAGVSGLTCAVVLAEAGFDTMIYAREVSGTTSEAAAAIWYPYHIASPHAESWARTTFDVAAGLAGNPDAGVSLVEFELLDTGKRMSVPLMDTTRYLPYLQRRFGGTLVQREVTSFAELDADVIVDCAGFGARGLCGDDEMTPGHGIAVVVNRSAVERAIARTDDPDALMYVIPRARDCILGGYDKPLPPDDSEIESILARCRAAVPDLSTEIRATRRGIRPVRSTVRVELENVDGIRVVHNYGHGGAGFTVSWGCAMRVLELVRHATA
jgi:D-amino-acid oxidase